MQANDIARYGSRHPLWLGAALLVLLVAVGEWLEWPFLRAPLQRLAASALEREVAIGDDFGLRLFGPLRLRSNRLVIASPADGPALKDAEGRPRDLLRAEDFALKISYLGLYRLLSGGEQAATIEALEVARLDAALARDAAGRANWKFGKQREQASKLPEFERLAVRNGQIDIEDAPLRLALDATVRTLEGTQVDPAVPGAVAPGLELAAVGAYRGEPLTASLRTSGLLPLAASRADAPVVPLRAELRMAGTRLNLDGRGRDLLHLQSFSGRFALEGTSLSAVGDALKITLPTTAAFAMNGQLGKEGAIWNVIVDKLEVGASRLNGRFRYDPTPAVPALTGQLGGARLELPDLIPAFGGPRDRAAAAARERSRVLPQREFDIPALGFMNASVDVHLDSLTLGTAYLEPLEPVKGRVVLRDKVLAIDNLAARTARGDLSGKLSLDASAAMPRWHFDLAWAKVDLERFIKARDPVARPAKGAAKAGAAKGSATRGAKQAAAARNGKPAPAAADQPGYVSGQLSGRARLDGTGRSTAAMLASLDGSSQWWVSNGSASRLLLELIGLDVAQSLGLLVTGDERLPVRCAVANLHVKDGVMRPEVAVIETDLTTTNASGEISLAEERLALRFTAHPRNVSPLALRSPVRVEGSFADPQVLLDPASIGSRVAAAAALAVVTPVAALLALIDLGDAEKAVCQQALARMSAKPAPAPRR